MTTTNYEERHNERMRTLKKVRDAAQHFFNGNDTAIPILEQVSQWMHDTGKIEDAKRLLKCMGNLKENKCVGVIESGEMVVGQTGGGGM